MKIKYFVIAIAIFATTSCTTKKNSDGTTDTLTVDTSRTSTATDGTSTDTSATMPTDTGTMDSTKKGGV